MNIASVRIENFRSFTDETIEFNDYNCLVGPNGAGKSTVLNALNVFFRNSKSSSVDLLELCEEDFHCKNTAAPIRITVTFKNLSEDAKVALKDYVRQDLLVVSAVAEWRSDTRTAPVIQKGARLAMKEFSPFFMASADGKPVSELKAIFGELRKGTPDLPAASTKQAMHDTLRAYEAVHPEKLTLMESDDEFYGVSKGSHKLSPFIQWVFVPAVKDASSEQEAGKNTALGLLVERAVRSKVQFSEKIKQLREKTSSDYDAILAENQSALNDLSASLKERLGKWAHPEVELAVRWDKDPDKSVRVEEPFAKIFAGECGFVGEIGRLGHGLQRSYILAILEELASSEAEDAPRLLLGLEEPELFQHPPQAQHLAEVLQKLSGGNAQVTVCTHSPYFVVGKGFEDVRLIRKPRGSSAAKASRATFAELSSHLVSTLGEVRYAQPIGVRAKLHQVLQPALREMFFAPTLVLVEGLEDVAYITSALVLLDLWEKWRQCGAHIVPVHGKSELVTPLAIAQLLKIPAFVIFDADGDIEKPDRKAQQQKDNERLLKLLGQPAHPLFPAAASWQTNFVVWPSNLGAAVQADYAAAEWAAWKSETEIELGQPGGLEKNAICIATLLAKAWAAEKPSATLENLSQAVLTFAQTATI